VEKFIIKGGKKLEGKVDVSGAKNSALALMPATFLNEGINIIENAPEVNDIYTMMKLMTELGSNIKFENYTLAIDNSTTNNQVAPYELVKKMRASIYVLGPLLTRFGYAKVSMPGGCAWGPRPINLHLESMKKLGAEIELELGYIIAKSKRLHGAKIHFDIPSVGATGNTLMAASLAKGTTLISNAATEPEIVALEEYLTLMGAKINGIGTKIIEIEGVDSLSPARYSNIPDRIEAGTLLVAAGVTGGSITLSNVISKHLDTILIKLEEAGFYIQDNEREITLNSSGLISNVDVTTDVYPGFPTDMQAQWIALMSLAKGTSTITDTIYPDRFNHVPELIRLGADIEVVNNSAVVKGVDKLTGAKVMSTDLRASASLVIAGLAAEGTTEILRIYHIDRGYQRIEEKLKALGADIERVTTDEY